MILLLILLGYWLGAAATLLLICRNVTPMKTTEKGGNENLYKIAYMVAVLIWPVTLIVGLITLIFRSNENNT